MIRGLIATGEGAFEDVTPVPVCGRTPLRKAMIYSITELKLKMLHHSYLSEGFLGVLDCNFQTLVNAKVHARSFKRPN